MHMNQQGITVDMLFAVGVQYQVPLYQRRYVWNQTNWSALWNDICAQVDLKLSGRDSRHFVGAIVTRPIKNGRLSKFEIIDGQQRLATFQIILCAIRDVCQSDGYTEITHEIDQLVLNSQIVVARGTPDDQYKFLPALADRDAFRSIVQGDHVNDGHHLMLQAYAYFKAQVAAYVAGDNEKVYELLSFLLFNFIVVEVRVDLSGAHEKIFASINTGGRMLSEFDLLKNDIFLKLGTDGKKLYEYWECFEDPFWNPEILDQFLRDFLTAKLETEIETDDLFQLYNQHYRPALETDQGTEYELSELKHYAELYREKIERDA